MIVRSRSADVTVPDVSITEYVLRQARRLGDKPAIIDGPSGRVLTYGQLEDAIRRAATGLARRGLRKGDVVAIYSPNCPEYVVVFHAVASLGAVNTTVNPTYTADELAAQLQDSGARFLVTVPAVLDRAREAAARTGIEEIFVIGAADGARSLAELLEAPPEPARRLHRSRAETSSSCRTRAARRGCPRGSCSPTATWSRISGSARACRASSASASGTRSWPCCRSSTSTAWSSS